MKSSINIKDPIEFNYVFRSEVDPSKDKILAKVSYSWITGEVKVTNYTEDVLLKPFGVKENPTMKDLQEFFESRSFPQTRYNCQEVLEYLGLKDYDPFEIVKLNGGNCKEDNFFIEFL